MLLIGPGGTGKTGALVSLVEAGYKLAIQDYDNGLDIVANVLRKKGKADLLANVNYETLTDDRGFLGASIRPKQATAFQRGMKLLDNWPGLGPVSKWGPDHVLVIDSLTMLSSSALAQVLALNGRLASGDVQLHDWGKAQDAIEQVLAMVTGSQTKCNVIVMSHVAFIDDANGISQGYPMSLGKSLSPKIGNYFNNCLMTKTVGTGATAKRVIRTVPDGTVGVKVSIPGSLPSEMPIETGLATFFAAAKAQPQPTAAAAPSPPSPAPTTTPFQPQR